MLTSTLHRALPALVIVTIATLVFAIAPAHAATVTYLGQDTTTHDAWRSTSVAKSAAFDPNGDNTYGNDGYAGHSTYVGNGGSGPYLTILPTYISSIVHTGSTFTGNSYPAFDDPNNAIAPVVADTFAGIFNDGFIDFTLSSDATFVLTLMLGGNNSIHNPVSLTITQTVGGAASATTPSTPSSTTTVEYVFFEISGSAGDAFQLTALSSHSGGISSITGVAALAFEGPEPVPAPAALPAGLAMLGLAAARRRKR